MKSFQIPYNKVAFIPEQGNNCPLYCVAEFLMSELAKPDSSDVRNQRFIKYILDRLVELLNQYYNTQLKATELGPMLRKMYQQHPMIALNLLGDAFDYYLQNRLVTPKAPRLTRNERGLYDDGVFKELGDLFDFNTAIFYNPDAAVLNSEGLQDQPGQLITLEHSDRQDTNMFAHTTLNIYFLGNKEGRARLHFNLIEENEQRAKAFNQKLFEASLSLDPFPAKRKEQLKREMYRGLGLATVSWKYREFTDTEIALLIKEGRVNVTGPILGLHGSIIHRPADVKQCALNLCRDHQFDLRTLRTYSPDLQDTLLIDSIDVHKNNTPQNKSNVLYARQLFDAIMARPDRAAIMDVQDVYYGNTALLFALKNRMFNLAKMLILNGANLNLADKNGNTPLHIACLLRNNEVIDLLLQNGANANQPNAHGIFPNDAYVFDFQSHHHEETVRAEFMMRDQAGYPESAVKPDDGLVKRLMDEDKRRPIPSDAMLVLGKKSHDDFFKQVVIPFDQMMANVAGADLPAFPNLPRGYAKALRDKYLELNANDPAYIAAKYVQAKAFVNQLPQFNQFHQRAHYQHYEDLRQPSQKTKPQNRGNGLFDAKDKSATKKTGTTPSVVKPEDVENPNFHHPDKLAKLKANAARNNCVWDDQKKRDSSGSDFYKVTVTETSEDYYVHDKFFSTYGVDPTTFKKILKDFQALYPKETGVIPAMDAAGPAAQATFAKILIDDGYPPDEVNKYVVDASSAAVNVPRL